MNKAIFIDKDGTLVVDLPYNVDPAKICLTPFAGEALRKLKANGYFIIGITNQSGIARGLFNEDSLIPVYIRINELLMHYHIKVDGWFHCPHHPHGSVAKYSIDCSCRKPAPGLLWQAADQFNISLNQSWMIGDILNDIEAGSRAGCQTILVDNGNETEWIFNDLRRPTRTVKNLDEAASFILEEQFV